MGRTLLLLLLCAGFAAATRADIADHSASLQARLDDAVVDVSGDGDAVIAADLLAAADSFLSSLRHPDAQAIWAGGNVVPLPDRLGRWQGNVQHAMALEMLAAERAGDVPAAQQWRAEIALPRHASAVEGAVALQRLGGKRGSERGVSRLLAREYISWQTTRIREKLDAFQRAAADGHSNSPLNSVRFSEIATLLRIPPDIFAAAEVPPASIPKNFVASEDPSALLRDFAAWRATVETSLPSLLTAEEVARRERMLLKLLLLVPKEYQAGVRDGEIVVPLEYREAQSFMLQASQIVNELNTPWRNARAAAHATHFAGLRNHLELAEAAIRQKASPRDVEAPVKAASRLLQDEFGLTLARGSGAAIVEETALEVRSLLKQSLAQAQASQWRLAESARVDAYTSFDTAIEPRVLPRAPELGIRAERSFLDGVKGQPGIKTVLDRRLQGPELEAAYQRTLDAIGECQTLLKVSVSPATIAFTASTIVMREGMEAVVILAALLAGLRGPQNDRPRRFLVMGAWCAVLGSILTFVLSRTLISGLIHYGERLEAIISLLAVGILLMVTNWVFHKVYWVQWNTKLRHLYRSVEEKQAGSRWEWLSLVGVGFLTIYREGFETSLFLQSLILEGGMKATSIGFGIGLLFVGTVGTGVFVIGAKLPYRKLLVITGVLVVSIMITFIGSTVRLFQTVGWMPIHPITWLDIPSWMGLWLGLYPSWEGMLLPPLGVVYVGSAWLWTKWQASRKPPAEVRPAVKERAAAELVA